MSAVAASAPIAARAVEPEGYAIGGRAPRFAARPTKFDELIEIVRACAADGLGIVPWGGGVSLPHDPPIENYDLALDLTGLRRVVEYEPEDLTLTVECGMTLAALRERLAGCGQELPLEGAHAERATVGGVLAANASGPRRRHLGGSRDRILGARFLLGDGTLARTGGKVVKNVAGYGIHRLLVGSRGGLAILVDASFKLLPAPESRVAMIYAADRAWLERPEWTAIARWEPAVCTVVSSARAREAGLAAAAADRYWVALGFEDDAARVNEVYLDAVQRLGVPPAELRDSEAEGLWQMLADLEGLDAPSMTFASPEISPRAALVASALGALDFVFHAPAGRLHLFPGAEPPGGPDTPRRWAASLAESGFARIASRGVEWPSRLPTPTSALRSRIRSALDPGDRFPLGRNWQQGTG